MTGKCASQEIPSYVAWKYTPPHFDERNFAGFAESATPFDVVVVRFSY